MLSVSQANRHEIGREIEETSQSIILVLSQQLPEWSKENHKKPKASWSAVGPRTWEAVVLVTEVSLFSRSALP
jgi:hypothetical protein